MSTVNEKLDSFKDKYANVVLVGLDEKGNLSMDSTFEGVHEIQYVLGRASFELHVYEVNQRQKPKEETGETK